MELVGHAVQLKLRDAVQTPLEYELPVQLQGVHDVEPVELVNWPRAHVLQGMLPVAENWPSGH